MSSSTPQHRPPFTTHILSHNPIRTLSLPAAHRERRQSSNRVRFEAHQISNGSRAESLCSRSPHLPAAASTEHQRSLVAKPGSSRIPCRIQSGGLIRLRKEPSRTLGPLPVRHPEPKQISKQTQAERPQMSSGSPLEPTRVADPQEQSARRTLFLPIHSRAALSPCLSSPSKINCALSTLNPGGCQQLLQQIHRPIPSDENQNQVIELPSKIERKSYTLSPSWCSPNIHSAAHKHNFLRSRNHEADNPILSIFLKNNGGYLDDSDEEEEEDGEEQGFGSIKATVAFLKRIPYPFEFRKPSSISSPDSNETSSSTISTRIGSSNPSTDPISRQSSRQYYWNRLPITPTKTVAQFTC